MNVSKAFLRYEQKVFGHRVNKLEGRSESITMGGLCRGMLDDVHERPAITTKLRISKTGRIDVFSLAQRKKGRG